MLIQIRDDDAPTGDEYAGHLPNGFGRRVDVMQVHVGEHGVNRSSIDREALGLSKATIQPFNAQKLLTQDLEHLPGLVDRQHAQAALEQAFGDETGAYAQIGCDRPRPQICFGDSGLANRVREEGLTQSIPLSGYFIEVLSAAHQSILRTELHDNGRLADQKEGPDTAQIPLGYMQTLAVVGRKGSGQALRYSMACCGKADQYGADDLLTRSPCLPGGLCVKGDAAFKPERSKHSEIGEG
jgi:hypothetical protein